MYKRQSPTTTVSDPAPGNTIEGGTGNALYFGNEFDYAAIAPIIGDYFPTSDVDSLVSIARDVAPMIVLPDVIFFGIKGSTSSRGSAEGYTMEAAASTGDTGLIEEFYIDDERLDEEGFGGYVGIVGRRELVGDRRPVYSDGSFLYAPGVGGVPDPSFVESVDGGLGMLSLIHI